MIKIKTTSDPTNFKWSTWSSHISSSLLSMNGLSDNHRWVLESATMRTSAGSFGTIQRWLSWFYPICFNLRWLFTLNIFLVIIPKETWWVFNCCWCRWWKAMWQSSMTWGDFFGIYVDFKKKFPLFWSVLFSFLCWCQMYYYLKIFELYHWDKML